MKNKESKNRHAFMTIWPHLDYICADLAPSQICRQSESQIIRLLRSLSSSFSLSYSFTHTAEQQNRGGPGRPLLAQSQSALKIPNGSDVFLFCGSTQHFQSIN